MLQLALFYKWNPYLGLNSILLNLHFDNKQNKEQKYKKIQWSDIVISRFVLQHNTDKKFKRN